MQFEIARRLVMPVMLVAGLAITPVVAEQSPRLDQRTIQRCTTRLFPSGPLREGCVERLERSAAQDRAARDR